MIIFKKLHCYAISDVGLLRDHNEDTVFQDEKRGLLILADGMGGAKAGEVASQLAITIIEETIAENFNVYLSATKINEIIKKSIIKANSVIYNIAQNQPSYKGMGTTVVVALFHKNQLFIAYVGDSRLYCLRAQNLTQLTRDHSLIQETIDKGYYTQEQAEQAFPNNIITRAVGTDPTVQPSLMYVETLADDYYLLCSDGLSDMLSKQQLLESLQQHSGNLKNMAEHLIQQANAHGGKDNISVILASLETPFKRAKNWSNFFKIRN